MNNLNGTIIWENTNPSGSFGETTIPIDLTQYEGRRAEILFRYAEGIESSSVQLFNVIFGRYFYFLCGYGSAIYTRRMLVSSDSLKFFAGVDNKGSTTSNHIVPLKIIVI